MNYDQSHKLFERAKKLIPGGVNSPVRAFKSVGGQPIFINKAKGAYLIDEDGNAYLDMINSWGPMIMGHAYSPVVEAIKNQTEKSSSYGTPTELELRIAELITSMVPNIEKIRMVNSGTEACMSAVRLARGYTGKDKIIKFAGCYHGHADCFLIQAGSGAVTFGEPNSPGVTAGVAKDTLIADYNNLENVKEIVAANKDEIACIILEPVAGNMGCIPPKEGFLKGLRSLCDEEGILLIFDEVMTGFRLAKGGAQEIYDVKSDLVTYGKVIGGGMPVGAFGGKHEIMDYLAPVGPVYQAGTLSGNPVAMAAGYTLLKELNDRPEIFSSLEKKTTYLKVGLQDALNEKGMEAQINQVGSMISLHFCSNEVYDFSSAKSGDNEHFKSYFHAMLRNGVYLPPSAYETWFISEALSMEHIDYIVSATKESIDAAVSI